MTTVKRERAVLAYPAALIAVAIPAMLFAAWIVHSVAALRDLGQGPSPYFIPAHALLLQGAAPLALLSMAALLMAPGLILALALGWGRTLAGWLLSGFCLSYLVASAGAILLQAVVGTPLIGLHFSMMLMLIAAAGAAVLLYRERRVPGGIPLPLDQEGARSTLIVALGLGAGAVALLVPKLFWENFNCDGVHVFETARILLFQPLPFWPAEVGNASLFPSVKSVLSIYPISWFVRLIGETEAASRLCYLFILMVLYCGMTGVIEEGMKRRMNIGERVLLALAMLLYTVAMAFNASEDPYNADIGCPGVQDALLMVSFCLFMLCFLRDNMLGIALSVALVYLTSPNAQPMLGAWILGVGLFVRPIPVKQIALIIGMIAGMILLEAAAPHLLRLMNIYPPGAEHGTLELINRIVHVHFDQVIRFAWAFVPVGIVPGLALIAYPWQDRSTRAIAFAGLVLFLFYYLQWRHALHYFAPAMVLSLIALWRTRLHLGEKPLARVVAPLAAAGLAIGFVLAWPTGRHLLTISRDVGVLIDDRTRGYTEGDPLFMKRIAIQQALFPRPNDPRVPDHAYGGHPQVWNFYAHHSDVPAAHRNYIMAHANDAPEPGTRRIAANEEVALYVRDEALWRQQAQRVMSENSGSTLLFVPKAVRFTNGPPSPLLELVKEILGRKKRSKAPEGPQTAAPASH